MPLWRQPPTHPPHQPQPQPLRRRPAATAGAALRSLVGDWPAASGALARVLAALRSLTGSWPNGTGTLARVLGALRALTGSWPAQSGALSRTLQALRALAGSQPTATGALTSWKWAPFAPDEDLSAGGWTTQAGATTGLFGVVDEATASDADYVRSAASPAADELVLAFPAVADAGLGADGSLRVRFRYAKPAGVAARIDLAVTLRGGATDVATATLTDIPDAFTDGALTLTAAEVAAFRAAGGFADARLALVAEEV